MNTGGAGALRGLRWVNIWLIILAATAVVVAASCARWAYLYPLAPSFQTDEASIDLRQVGASQVNAIDVACSAARNTLEGPQAEQVEKKAEATWAAADTAKVKAEAAKRKAADAESRADAAERRARTAKGGAKTSAAKKAKVARREARNLKRRASDAQSEARAADKAATKAHGEMRQRAAGVQKMFEAANITERNHRGLPKDCSAMWAKAVMVSSGMRFNAVQQACQTSQVDLREGRHEVALTNFSNAGVTKDNLQWLSDDCANLWMLASAPKPGSPSGKEPAGSAASSGAPAVPPKQWGDQWDKFITNYAGSFQSVAAFALAGWLGLFVLARLLVEAPWLRHRASSRGERRTAGWVGWLLLILTPVVLAVAGVATGGELLAWPPILGMFIAVGFLGLLGSVGVAAWLACLLKLTVTAAEDKSKQIQIVARLRELATNSSKNIEFQGSQTIGDVNQTLTDISQASWVATLQKVLMFLVGISPWVAIAQFSGSKQASVSLARNGRVILARSVRTDGPGLEMLGAPPPPADADAILAVFVAAEILLGMRPAYAKDFAPGLNGATEAQSVALQHVAARWYMSQATSAEAVALLRRAVAIDPSNELAIITLENACWRQSTSLDELVKYGHRLDARIKPQLPGNSKD